MKLFVWTEVFSGYYGGIGWALAETVEEARAMLRETPEGKADPRDLDSEPDIFEVTEKICFAMHGGD